MTVGFQSARLKAPSRNGMHNGPENPQTKSGLLVSFKEVTTLGAILEVLGQNKTDDLEIESDSRTSLRAICIHSDRYEDLNFKTQTRLKGF